MVYTYLGSSRTGRTGSAVARSSSSTPRASSRRCERASTTSEICEPQRDEITRLYGDFTEGEHVRIFDNQDFGFRRITVERPLRLKVSPPSKRIRNFRCYGASKKRKEKKAAEAEAAAGARSRRRSWMHWWTPIRRSAITRTCR